MINSRLSYKSMADYDYHRVLNQKRNLSQVQQVLTLYENNNQTLVDQVHDLIKQNQILRKQAKSSNLTKSKIQPYKPNYSLHEHTENSQIDTTVRSTNKKHSTLISNSKLRLNHPRDVYLPAQQAHLMNMKRLKQAQTAHKKYDRTREFQQFKEKLSAKKEQLKKEYAKKIIGDNSELSLSRKVYIDRPEVETREFNERKPLVQAEKLQHVVSSLMPGAWIQKRDNSPYNQFKRETPVLSPSKATGKSYKQPPKSCQRSSSAIKIEEVYPANCVRIAEPKTKWSDLSSTYFERSKRLDRDGDVLLASYKFGDEMGQSKSGKSGKKKFLNVVSLSVLEEKLRQKGQA